MDAALTATEWAGRILGKSELPRLPLLCCWYATGNNVICGADAARRTCNIRIESPEERPEDRENFRHPDLLAWVAAVRPRLLRAALTILTAYVNAGRPQAKLKPWGSFEGWSDLVRQCVVWLGMPDPHDTTIALADTADQDVATLQTLLSTWESICPGGISVTVAAFLGKMEADKINLKEERENLETVVPGRNGGLPDAAKLGAALRRYKGRVYGGRLFDGVRNRNGVTEWRVVSAGHAGHADASKTAGTAPNGTQTDNQTAGSAGHAGLEGHVSTHTYAGAHCAYYNVVPCQAMR